MERYDLLKEWMRDNRVTFRWLASKLGISGPRIMNLLRANRISIKRHADFVELGFPVELLPKAEDYIPRGRPPKIPDYGQDSKATA